MEQAYYYSRMNRTERSVYDAILSCVTSLGSSARVLLLPQRELAEIYCRMKLDHPEIFWLKDYTVCFAPGADYGELRPEYLFDRGKIRDLKKSVEARIAKLTRPLQGASESEKEAFIHRFILEHVQYDKLEKEYSHEVYGPLTLGIGVCEGIAKTVKILCGALGMECLVVICEADPENGVRYRHAWNLVKVQEKWCHLDATYDNTLSACGIERLDYYNLDDRHIFRDHRPSLFPIPEAAAPELCGYRQQKLSFTKTEDAAKRFSQVLRKKQTAFAMHWRGGAMTAEVLQLLVQSCTEAAAERELYARCEVNRAQSVFFVRFTTEPPESAACEESRTED